MATKILHVKNYSDTPVAYVGLGGLVPTGWSSWAFAPNGGNICLFGWVVETNKGNQVLLTKAGTFTIWDDGNWNIWCQDAKKNEQILVTVHQVFPREITIELNIDGYGYPNAIQN
ncbi:MAG: hypothetical protein IPP78_04570 [Holophagaceae bacterium]|nr:hypothetical protein [Holophagaceae bacterium]